MTKTARVIICVLSFSLVTSLLTAHSPRQEPVVRAQSLTPNADLATGFRLDVNNLFNALESFHAHLQEKTDRNLTFASGDLTGNNANITAATLNQAVTDLNSIYGDIHNGGTVSVGQWANVIKIK